MSDLNDERITEEPDRLAEELDAFLTARLAGRELPAHDEIPPAERGVAEALLRLAETMRPDPGFAAQLEAQLRDRAARAAPPASPDRPAHRPRPRSPAPAWRGWAARAAGLALILMLLLSAVPSVRAGVLAFLRIGTVSVALSPTVPSLTAPTAAPTASAPPTPTVAPLTTVLDLAGETTFADAQRRATFPIRLPSYPPDLGLPDKVFFQDLGGPAVVLVWMDPAQPSKVRFSLHQLSATTFAQKGEPVAIAQTQVNGRAALWTDGPYMLEYVRGNQAPYGARRIVNGHVLLWEDQGVTYRLETELTLAEAVRIAESLR